MISWDWLGSSALPVVVVEDKPNAPFRWRANIHTIAKESNATWARGGISRAKPMRRCTVLKAWHSADMMITWTDCYPNEGQTISSHTRAG